LLVLFTLLLLEAVVSFEFLACNKQYSTCVSWFVGLFAFLQARPSGFPSLALYAQGIGVAQFLLAMPMAISLCLQQRVNLPRDMEEFILVNLPSRRVKAMMLHLRGSLVNIGFLTWAESLAK